MAGQKRFPKSTRVRFTDEEHERLSGLAQAAGLSISRYLIEAALNEKARTSEEGDAADVLLLVRSWAITEVARAGTELNQIAWQLNAQKGTVNSERIVRTLNAVAAALTELHRLWPGLDSE